MRKPRPPHQARRVHGPRAALAGYKNLASSISCSSSPSSFSHNPEFSTSATLGARASNPTSSNQAPLIGHAAAEKTTPARCGLSTTRIRDRPLQLRCCWAAVMRIPSQVHSHWSSYELSSVQAFSQSASPSHHHRPLPAAPSGDWDATDWACTLGYNRQSRKCLTTTRLGFCLAAPCMPQVDDALAATWWAPRLPWHTRVRFDCAALGWSEAAGSYDAPLEP